MVNYAKYSLQDQQEFSHIFKKKQKIKKIEKIVAFSETAVI